VEVPAWCLGLLVVVRLPWVEQRLVHGLIDAQQNIAGWYGARPSGLVLVNASCSGADVVAVTMAVLLAYPVSWTRRFAGVAGAALLLLALNTARIGSLVTLTPSQPLFTALHLYVWPATLVLAAAVYVLVWSRAVDRHALPSTRSRILRFGLCFVALAIVHAAAAPWTYASPSVRLAGVWTAGASARVLSTLGVAASAEGDVLSTGRGVFQVTPECLLSPVLLLYLAAAATVPLSPGRRWAAAALALPVFFALGVLRTLLLALPPAIAPAPLVFVHGFFQIALGTALVAAASIWVEGRRGQNGLAARALGRFAGAWVAAVAVAAIAGGAWRDGVLAAARSACAMLPHTLVTWRAPDDVQGAMALLPVYQLALLLGLALSVAPSLSFVRACQGLAVLAVSQLSLLVAFGELGAHMGVTIHALVPRALAVAVPVGLVSWLIRPPRTHVLDMPLGVQGMMRSGVSGTTSAGRARI
jgi:exosortase/archaeosortase family protein